MGQCKSKTGVLEPGLDVEGAAAKEKEVRKVTRRKWRKRKGYSLSASLEADLHTVLDSETGAETAGGRGAKHGTGLVLVSYNLTEPDAIEPANTPLQSTIQEEEEQDKAPCDTHDGDDDDIASADVASCTNSNVNGAFYHPGSTKSAAPPTVTQLQVQAELCSDTPQPSGYSSQGK